MKLPNTWYDILKWVTMIVLPALATAYVGLAAIWGTWARYVYKNCLDRFVKFAINVMEVEPGATDEETAIRGIEAMEDFYRRIGMPTSIHELGVDPTEEQIKIMAHNAIIASGGKRGSAKVLYEDDFVKIYKAARDDR